MSCFGRFGSGDALLALAAALFCGTAALAVEPGGNALTYEGWTIAADTDHARLTIKHERLGTILQEVRLNLEAGGTLREQQQWKVDTSVSGRLVVRTLSPATTWSFEPAGDHLTISSTATGAVLTARAPVSPARRLARLLDPEGAPVTWQGTGEVAGTYGGSFTRNPSFLPRENPECMYFALGQVTGSVFHNLFDQGTDTAIKFPEQSRFSARGPGTEQLGLAPAPPGAGLAAVGS